MTDTEKEIAIKMLIQKCKLPEKNAKEVAELAFQYRNKYPEGK